jgi:hypothetical protein
MGHGKGVKCLPHVGGVQLASWGHSAENLGLKTASVFFSVHEALCISLAGLFVPHHVKSCLLGLADFSRYSLNLGRLTITLTSGPRASI